MPGYAKFIKDLITKKRSVNYDLIDNFYRCSAVATRSLVEKKDDPGAFTIPCTIGSFEFARALCDLGASINLMPFQHDDPPRPPMSMKPPPSPSRSPSPHTASAAMLIYWFVLIDILGTFFGYLLTLMVSVECYIILLNFVGYFPRQLGLPWCERLALDGFRRGRGRPKKYWGEVIRRDMEQLQLTEDMTLDRKDPKFQSKRSSTYQSVKCDKACPCGLKRQQCIYERQHSKISSSFGLLGEDVISFGNLNGIMGLGRGDVSIVDQLVEKHVTSDSFSLYYGGMDFGGGVMVLGGINPPALKVFTKSDFDPSPYYNIELKEILVAGKPQKINPRVFGGKHRTILDSGTTYALPSRSNIYSF
ncbi:hypothetical protein CQW23_14091 [Capsicum baccatum]|uniref:Peptidase A1 domain-containing protein n=1 Tax=Capsicum baccatum TaxID=33114 RepID=A0A2G2WI78_CAPBA|nr:hypothetical protein CQW23_14091 [Capsicum baccatum]